MMRETRSEPWFWRSADEFGRLRLENGSHQGPDEGVCLMEAVAWLAREPHSDDPKCVCPVLGAFGRDLNDRLDVERRQRLKPLIPALVGTASDGHAEARGFMAMDWIVRTYTPAWLRLAGLDSEADGLQALPEIADAATRRRCWMPPASRRPPPGTLPGRLPGTLPGTLPWPLPWPLPGPLPGALPGTLPGALPGPPPGPLPGPRWSARNAHCKTARSFCSGGWWSGAQRSGSCVRLPGLLKP